MDYDQSIQEIISVLKADKSVIQPWRNYAIKHLMEAQAHVKMGLTTTNREPDDHPAMQFAGPVKGGADIAAPQCICTPGMPPRKDCPVHGGKG